MCVFLKCLRRVENFIKQSNLLDLTGIKLLASWYINMNCEESVLERVQYCRVRFVANMRLTKKYVKNVLLSNRSFVRKFDSHFCVVGHIICSCPFVSYFCGNCNIFLPLNLSQYSLCTQNASFSIESSSY
jgi:hypothetical protein